MRKQFLITVSVAIVSIIVLSLGVIYVIPYLTTPDYIRRPALDHLHFRIQVAVGGTPVNFGEDKFQETKPDVCTEDIPETPIHFHDGMDQMVHVHWQGITGGEILKYYGWNFIGDNSKSLGARFDTGWPKDVPIHGDVLPTIPAGSNYYVYTGDSTGYQRKDWQDFLHKNIPSFLGTDSNFGRSATLPIKLGDFMYTKAYAHGGEVHGDETLEELQRINNLIGNVVIFVQNTEPTDQQIKDRFNNLMPLSNSTCGG